MDDYYPHSEKLRPQLQLTIDMKDNTDNKTLTATFITIDSERHNDSLRFSPTRLEINAVIETRFTGLDRDKIRFFSEEISRVYELTEHHLTLFYSEK